MGKKMKMLARRCDDVAACALASEVIVSPRNDERTLPDYVPTRSEFKAFHEGVAVALAYVSAIAEEGEVGSGGSAEEVGARLVASWVDWRKSRAEGGDDD